MFDYDLCEGRVLAVPRSDRKVVGLMPGLCAALCGFGLFSLRVPGLPPGFLTPTSDSHMKADQQLWIFLSVGVNSSKRWASVFLVDGSDASSGLPETFFQLSSACE